MKIILSTSLIALLALFAVAQSPSLVWQHAYGGSLPDYTRAIALTPDGGFAFLAAAESTDGDVVNSHGEADYWLVKVSAQGNTEWQKCYGGSLDDYGWDMALTADGGFILTGYSDSHDGDVTGNHGNFDYWVVKTDASGTLQWEKSYGGSAYEAPYGIEQTSDHGYVIAGSSVSHDGDVTGAHGNKDAWIIKIDSTGILQWQKDVGGFAIDDAFDVQQTTDGGYIVAGNSASVDGDVSGGHGSDDFFVFKLNNSGNLEWTRCYGGSASELSRSVRQTADGGYVVLGFTESNNGNVSGNHGLTDMWLIKINFSGDLQWQKCLGGTKDDFGRVVRIAEDGGWLVAGPTRSSDGDITLNNGYLDFWLAKLDTSQNVEWEKSVGGSQDEYDYTFEFSGNNFYLGGLSKSNDGDVTINQGEQDVWIAKLALCDLYLSKTVVDATCSGNDGSIDISLSGGTTPFTYQWSNGASSQDLSGISPGSYSIKVTDAAGCTTDETISVGSSTYGVPINLSTVKITTTAARLKWSITGAPTGFDVRYKLTSSLIWLHKNINDGTKTSLRLINLQPSSQYEWQIREKCGVQSSSYSSSQIFTTASMKEENSTIHRMNVLVYPNPSGGILHIEMNGNAIAPVTIRVADLEGRIVYAKTIAEFTGETILTLDLNSLINGSYLIFISNDETSETLPIVIAR